MARKPQRIAPPAIIAEAAAVIYGKVAACTAITDAQRHLWENAITKAFNQLMDGVRFERIDDGVFRFPSRTRSGIAHHVNGACDCEASAELHQPCWHRAAKRLVLIIDQRQAAPEPTPPAAPVAPQLPPPPPVPALAVVGGTATPQLAARGPGRNRIASRFPAGRSAQEEIDELYA